MIKNMKEILKFAKERGPKTIAVAVAEDLDVLLAVSKAQKLRIADAILVGDQDKIEKIAKTHHIDITACEMIHEKDIKEASRKAVALVSTGKAYIVMKGLVDTAIILKAVLNQEIGLRTGNVLSHTAVFEVPNYDRLIFVTDAAMNIAPDLMTKKQIIENAVEVAYALDIDTPKVAVVCAKEKVNPKMPPTVDAQKLEDMNKEGAIKGCMVGGPFALDNAVSKKAAKHKGIDHPVAGCADILLVPNIESGNVLYKSMVFFSDTKNAGVIVGAKAPIVLTSRADSDETKLNSIALAVLMAAKKSN
ncbi:phosphate butyryltransferase [Marinisporobacter balticus]|uniref:Phosphate butyryltransferase n=1 Tax=Marinisporobacter balticus TaxID=2018667 RepID=A0A4R2KP05_9FIRM|nr:phosphate butyryltransferase [Marinisporobacter balticus]TCO71798.1 phosphate butyryltransferase [Marinisporobacter balticus]